MCLSVFQDKKKRMCVASSLHVLKLNNCNNVTNNKNEGKKHGSYERVLQRKRCLK
jgi:hypothetical protein